MLITIYVYDYVHPLHVCDRMCIYDHNAFHVQNLKSLKYNAG